MITIEIGYQTFVLPREKAMAMMELLEQAEVYECKYITKEDRERMGISDGTDTIHYVYPNDRMYAMKLMSDDLYRMAKLAGKPGK